MISAIATLMTLACVSLGDPHAPPAPPAVPAPVAAAPAPRAPRAVRAASVAPRPAPAPQAARAPLPSGPGPELEGLRKELEIMRVLLDKRVFQKEHAGQVGLFWSGHVFEPLGSSTEALYVKGDGALFLMRTSDPVAPGGEDVVHKGDPRDEWDRVEGELDGLSFDEPDEEPRLYDETKVDRLRNSVLDTLAEYGGRLDHVADGEHVTVVVRGSMPTGTIVAQAGGAEARAAVEYAVASGGVLGDFGGRRQSSVLTVRVSKADCVAAAEGRLTADQFRERAVVSQY